MRAPRLVPAVVALAAGGAVLGGSAATADTAHVATATITPTGVGDVRLGATFRALRRSGAIGPQRRGCELEGPDARAAALRSPLRGSVALTPTTPRRVVRIQVTGGARARGVGVGSRSRAVRRAFPRARWDRSGVATFGIVVVRVPRGDGGRLQLAVDATTGRVTTIGIPTLAFCE